MPTWHCRLATPSLKDAELCDGPRHGECGVRYAAGEFAVGKDGLHLDGIPGAIRMPGLAFMPHDRSAVIVWHDKDGMIAEFVRES